MSDKLDAMKKALEILEAGGVEAGSVTFLKAEISSEVAKYAADKDVIAYRNHVYETEDISVAPWETMTEKGRDSWRKEYAERLEFFKSVLGSGAPRVIEEPGDEPDRTARWEDTDKDVWNYNEVTKSWGFITPEGREYPAHSWPDWEGFYPLKEVK